MSPSAAAASAVALEGGWRASDAGEQATSVTRDDSRLQRFDPTRLKAFGTSASGAWILLWPAEGRPWPPAPWVLEVKSPGLQTVTVYPPGADVPDRAQLLRSETQAWPGHGRLVFPMAAAPASGQPLRLHVDAHGVIPAALTFTVLSVPEHLRADARWLAFASACLAIMVAMAIVALLFALRLRDVTFVYYAVFVFAYAAILSLQTGYVADPLGWHSVADSFRIWARASVAASVVFAILFMDRFADLPRHVPGGRRWLLGYAGVIGSLTALAALPIPGMDALSRLLINPLLILGGPALLWISAMAAWRGSRYAGFFLFGWTPLLAVTVLESLQLYGFASQWTWSSDAALAAGAFEAMVLSLGLADRSLALRHDRDQARVLADIDPLTGVYNRRAWSDRLSQMESTTHRQKRPLSLLFLDIDRFKELNDRLGHGAGDVALRALAQVMREELRDQDRIGRYGGEEFVIALPGVDRARALQVAERIRRRLSERMVADPAGATPTVSIGVATRRNDEDMPALIQRADAAMYAAKTAGRDRVALAE